MSQRLNVTEAERLSYSRRKLQAISALRNAELSAEAVLRGKEPRPHHSGRFYRLTLPDASVVYFTALGQVIAYAHDYNLYTTTMCQLEEDERISWQRWLADGSAYALALLVPQLRAVARQSPKEPSHAAAAPPPASEPGHCSWPECPYPATGYFDHHAYCAGHAHIYRVCLEAKAGVA